MATRRLQRFCIDTSAWPVGAAIRHFRSEFEFHVENPEIVKNVKHGSLEKYKEVPVVTGE